MSCPTLKAIKEIVKELGKDIESLKEDKEGFMGISKQFQAVQIEDEIQDLEFKKSIYQTIINYV